MTLAFSGAIAYESRNRCILGEYTRYLLEPSTDDSAPHSRRSALRIGDLLAAGAGDGSISGDESVGAGAGCLAE